MRIVLMNDQIPPEGKGGAESVVWRLAQGLAHAGHDVHIVATTPDEAFEDIREGIQTHHLHAKYPKRFRAWLSLRNPQIIEPFRQLMVRLQPDVINAHNIHFYLSYHTLEVAHDLGIPTVFSSHDVMPFAYTKLNHFIKPETKKIKLPQDYRLPVGFNLRQNRLRYNPLRNPIIRRYLTRYPTFRTAPSQALADALAANRLPAFQVVHNGIQPEEWAKSNSETIEALRKRLSLHNKQVILIAGRLTSHKGTLQLLAAMHQLVDALPSMRLLVLTSGNIEKQIPMVYQHLHPYIVSGGWLTGEELVAAYHLADIAVTPSIIFDSFPTVNLEAMAVGLPVIATCFGGSQEVVIDSETGYIINPYNTKLFASRLYDLLTDDNLRQTMGHKAQQLIHYRFTLNHQVDTMLSLYEQAIQEKAQQ